MTRPMQSRDHGGGLDAAAAAFSGARGGLARPVHGHQPAAPTPVGEVTQAGLGPSYPDRAAAERFIIAARSFWSVPEGAAILPALRRQRADSPACLR